MDIYQCPIAFTAIMPTGSECVRSTDFSGENMGEERIYLAPHHEIWDIGLIVANPEKLEIIDSYSAALKIDRPEIVEEYMKLVRGPVDVDKLNAATEDPVDVLNNYFQRVQKDFVFAAFRVELELKFLQIYSEVYGIQPNWWPHKIDVYSYALGIFDALRKKLPSPDMFRIAASLGLIASPPPYRAIDQAQLTYEIFKKLRTMK